MFPTVVALGAWSAVAMVAVVGCLPAGDPPPGQQVVRDRTATYAFFSSSGSDSEASRLFCIGPERSAPYTYSGFGGTTIVPVSELYALPYGQDAGAPQALTSLQPVLSNVEPFSYGVVGFSPVVDAFGRLFLPTLRDSSLSPSQTSPYDPGPVQMTRFDPSTGEKQGSMSGNPLFSPSRARLFAPSYPSGALFEREGSRSFPDVRQPMFIGEDLYFVAGFPPSSGAPGPGSYPTSWTLTRVKPNAEPEALLVSSSSMNIAAIDSDRGPRLLVSQGWGLGPLPALFIFDVETLDITALPSDLKDASFASASSNGHWLLLMTSVPPTGMNEPSSNKATILDWTTGARTDLDPQVVGVLESWNDMDWRPGHDELWMQTTKGAFMLSEPGDILSPVASLQERVLYALPQAATERFSFFTADGRLWFSRRLSDGLPLDVGRADDPTLPPLEVAPQGTATSRYWDLGDERLLITLWAQDESRQQLYLIDMAAGTSRALAGGGQLVGASKTRALAVLDWDGARDSGTLTLIDLTSAAQTVLAEDVYKVAIDAEPFRSRTATVPFAVTAGGIDALARGTRVAYLMRGRLPSPYDGLWVTELP